MPQSALCTDVKRPERTEQRTVLTVSKQKGSEIEKTEVEEKISAADECITCWVL